MKSCIFLICVLALIVILPLTAAQKRSSSEDFERTQGYYPPGGYVPDAATAVKIPEAVLVPVYGEKLIISERPFKAELQGDVWRVEGTLHCEGGRVGSCPGGTGTVKLSKRDGRILFLMHYK